MATSPESSFRLRSRRSGNWLTAAVAVGVCAGLASAFWMTGEAVAGRPGANHNGTAQTIAVDDIKPGMRGYALTVFEGDKPDKFEIEVVDVVRDYVTGQDAVLFKSDDPRLVHSGIVGGMSGSPIYINDKLAGALAYGYRYNKDPLGGMTPISNMLEIADLPYRPEVFVQPGHVVRAIGRSGSDAWADNMLGLNTDPLPARMQPEQIPGPKGVPSGGLEPIGAPMAIAGLGAEAAALLADSTGLLPVRGGGKHKSSAPSGETAGPGKRHTWTPGDSVSVVLIAGDNGAAPNGTITWVGGKQGERLLAFGHPMYGGGPSKLPIADAHVHTILASVERSVKLSSAGDVQGTMIQDRQPAISLRTDIDTPMIPVLTSVQGAEGELVARSYSSSVADHQVLTPPLVATLLLDALDEAGGDAVEVVLETHHEIHIETSEGPRTITLDEEMFFPNGIIRGMVAQSRWLAVLSVALDNQFEIASIRSVTQSATLHYGAPVKQIARIRVGSGEIRAGELLELLVDLKGPRGPVETESYTIRIPSDAGGQRIVVELAGGQWIMPYAPLPNSLDDLLDNLAQSYPARSMVGSIYQPQEGLASEHGLVAELPESVLQTLTPSGSNRQAITFKRAARRVVRTDGIIEGEASLELEVLPASSFDQ
jgi:hypothetical protein